MDTDFGLLGHVDDLQQAATLSDTYTQIHTLLDLVQSVVDTSYPSSYFYVYGENQKLRLRLSGLENSAFGDFGGVTTLPDQDNAQHNTVTNAHYQSPILDPELLQDSTLDFDLFPIAPQPSYAQSSSGESTLASSATVSARRSSTATTISQTSPPAASAALNRQRSSKLTSKIHAIGSPITIEFAFEYTQSLDTTLSTSILQFNPVQYNSITSGFTVQDHSAFLRAIPNLGRAIESSTLAEQHYRIGRRIALAHFFRAYELAQANSKPFLAWCKDNGVMEVTPRGNPRAMVSQCFTRLLVPSTKHSSGDNHRIKAEKIQTWRKAGKPWATLIAAFGYAILLLMPDTMTDEDLRVLRECELEDIIQTIKDRQDDLSSTLETLNQKLDVYLATQEQLSSNIT